jgi:hypothetical protein
MTNTAGTGVRTIDLASLDGVAGGWGIMGDSFSISASEYEQKSKDCPKTMAALTTMPWGIIRDRVRILNANDPDLDHSELSIRCGKEIQKR